MNEPQPLYQGTAYAQDAIVSNLGVSHEDIARWMLDQGAQGDVLFPDAVKKLAEELGFDLEEKEELPAPLLVVGHPAAPDWLWVRCGAEKKIGVRVVAGRRNLFAPGTELDPQFLRPIPNTPGHFDWTGPVPKKGGRA